MHVCVCLKNGEKKKKKKTEDKTERWSRRWRRRKNTVLRGCCRTGYHTKRGESIIGGNIVCVIVQIEAPRFIQHCLCLQQRTETREQRAGVAI